MATRNGTRNNVAMSLIIKSNVEMDVRSTGEPLPSIPWDQMFFKDAFDIPVEEQDIVRKLAAVRSAYKRYLLKQEDPPEREFFIGQHSGEEGLVVRIYCKQGPIREDNQ